MEEEHGLRETDRQFVQKQDVVEEPLEIPSASSHFVCMSKVRSSVVVKALAFRTPHPLVALWKQTSVEFARVAENGELLSLGEYDLFGSLRSVCVLPRSGKTPLSHHQDVTEQRDLFVVVSKKGALSLLSFAPPRGIFPNYPPAPLPSSYDSLLKIAGLSLPESDSVTRMKVLPQHRLGNIVCSTDDGSCIAVSALERTLALYEIDHNSPRVFGASLVHHFPDCVIWAMEFVPTALVAVTGHHSALLISMYNRPLKVTELVLFVIPQNQSSGDQVSPEIHYLAKFRDPLRVIHSLRVFSSVLVAVGNRRHVLCLLHKQGLTILDLESCLSMLGNESTSENDQEARFHSCSKYLMMPNAGTSFTCVEMVLRDCICALADDGTLYQIMMPANPATTLHCVGSLNAGATMVVGTPSLGATPSLEGMDTRGAQSDNNMDEEKEAAGSPGEEGDNDEAFLIIPGDSCEGGCYVLGRSLDDNNGATLSLYDTVCALPNSAPVVAFEVCDALGEGAPQIYFGSGFGENGAVTMMRDGIGVKEVLEQPDFAEGLHNLFVLKLRADDAHHALLVFSFFDCTRVTSGGLTMNDLSTSSGFDLEGATLAATCVLGGRAAVQVTSRAINVIALTESTAEPDSSTAAAAESIEPTVVSGERVHVWNAPSDLQCAMCVGSFVLVSSAAPATGTSNVSLVELTTDGQLVPSFSSRLLCSASVPSTVSCLHLIPVSVTYLVFCVGCHDSSLALYGVDLSRHEESGSVLVKLLFSTNMDAVCGEELGVPESLSCLRSNIESDSALDNNGGDADGSDRMELKEHGDAPPRPSCFENSKREQSWLLVGLRNGILSRFLLNLSCDVVAAAMEPRSLGESSGAPSAPQEMMIEVEGRGSSVPGTNGGCSTWLKFESNRRVGRKPVRLTPLHAAVISPDRQQPPLQNLGNAQPKNDSGIGVGPKYDHVWNASVMCLSDRLWLVEVAPHSANVTEDVAAGLPNTSQRRLKILFSAVCTPLTEYVVPFHGPLCNNGVITVTGDGTLSIFQLERQRSLNVVRIPIGRTVRRLLWHSPTRTFIVVCQPSPISGTSNPNSNHNNRAEVVVVDPMTSTILSRLVLEKCESGASLSLFEHGDDTYVLLGTGYDLSPHSRACKKGRILVLSCTRRSVTATNSSRSDGTSQGVGDLPNKSLLVQQQTGSSSSTVDLRIMGGVIVAGLVYAATQFMRDSLLVSQNEYVLMFRLVFGGDSGHMVTLKPVKRLRMRHMVMSLSTHRPLDKTCCHAAVGTMIDGVEEVRFSETATRCLSSVAVDQTARMTRQTVALSATSYAGVDRLGNLFVVSNPSRNPLSPSSTLRGAAEERKDASAPSTTSPMINSGLLTEACGFHLGESATGLILLPTHHHGGSFEAATLSYSKVPTSPSSYTKQPQNFAVCTITGSVYIFKQIPKEHFVPLLDLQRRLAAWEQSQPCLSESIHNFRSPPSSLGEPIVDGDYVSQFLSLPRSVQARLYESVPSAESSLESQGALVNAMIAAVASILQDL